MGAAGGVRAHHGVRVAGVRPEAGDGQPAAGPPVGGPPLGLLRVPRGQRDLDVPEVPQVRQPAGRGGADDAGDEKGQGEGGGAGAPGTAAQGHAGGAQGAAGGVGAVGSGRGAPQVQGLGAPQQEPRRGHRQGNYPARWRARAGHAPWQQFPIHGAAPAAWARQQPQEHQASRQRAGEAANPHCACCCGDTTRPRCRPWWECWRWSWWW